MVEQSIWAQILSKVLDGLLGHQPASSAEPRVPQPPLHLAAVKLIHSSELANFKRFPRYGDYVGPSLYEYNSEHRRISGLKRKHADIISARDDIATLDSDATQRADDIELSIPATLFRRSLQLPLPSLAHNEAVLTPTEGRLDGATLIVQSGWRKRSTRIQVRCPSRILHAKRIAEARLVLRNASEYDHQEMDELRRSDFRHPVLFVSHRWLTLDHPDPEGIQLDRLRDLENCFLIYDYTSFPQPPFAENEEAYLQDILENMSHIIKNVVVLKDENYMKRGWCLYEYIASSLTGSIVCDEIADETLVRLRNWIQTEIAPSANPFHDGHEALSSNYKQKSILKAVNDFIPIFRTSDFSVLDDRALVRRLLARLLEDKLPPRRDYNPYQGESSRKSWSIEELEVAFESELKVESLDTIQAEPFVIEIPKTLRAATSQRYKQKVTSNLYFEIMSMSPIGQLQRKFADYLRRRRQDWD